MTTKEIPEDMRKEAQRRANHFGFNQNIVVDEEGVWGTFSDAYIESRGLRDEVLMVVEPTVEDDGGGM